MFKSYIILLYLKQKYSPIGEINTVEVHVQIDIDMNFLWQLFDDGFLKDDDFTLLTKAV